MYVHDKGPVCDLATAASFIRHIRTGQAALDIELQDIARRIAGIEQALRHPAFEPVIGKSPTGTDLDFPQ